ncbi:MAG: cupin domain-containing protein [Lachnospiraceae bacterium]|nr:cupin domain-containing protein [Lachnospiraceae bacterium]
MMYYVLLSGGSGRRLWPLSGERRPKQYLKMVNRENNSMDRCSMIQRVWEQLEEAGMAERTVITAGKDQEELILSQIRGARIALEPEGRDTFPAVLLSCAYLHSRMGATEEDYVTVMPVDPYTESSYFQALRQLEQVMSGRKEGVGLMGVVPTHPSSKYGYILTGDRKEGYVEVLGFAEKPEEERAEELIRQKALWNCGVFCVRIGSILQYARAYGVSAEYEKMYENYKQLPRISFDYEVLEKTEELVAVEYHGFWRDLGTWDAMAEQMSTDIIGNALLDEDCKNTQVINELGIPVVAMGLENMVVVAARDGILITDKRRAGRVKEVASGILTPPMFEERRWGTLETLDDTGQEDRSTLTRKINIYDGMNSSYHYHQYRDEIWTVLRGSGELILEGSKIPLSAGKAVCIRRGQRHAVKAMKDFEYIEIHIGEKIGNEDINRITFRWDEIELSRIL